MYNEIQQLLRKLQLVNSVYSSRCGYGLLMSFSTDCEILQKVSLSEKYCITCPSRSTRYLQKFQLGVLPETLVRYLYTAQVCSPRTSTLENNGNVTPYASLTNCTMSCSLPGSCWPNWLQGKANTVKPLEPYFAWSLTNSL